MAFVLAPRDANQAVMVVPMFSPSTTAAEIWKTLIGSSPNQPLIAQVIVIAIAAEEDCTMRVSTIPAARKST